MTRRIVLGVALVAGSMVVSGCGVPPQTSPEVVTAVPYELTKPSSPRSTPRRAPQSANIKVWLVRDDALVPVVTPAAGPDVLGTAADAAKRLASGPSDNERAQGFSTALGPDVKLSVTAVEGGRAIVDIGPGEQSPSAGQLPLAVGQVVLTLTSIPGIADVALTTAGGPIEAPLPGGVLTERPLTARDYAYLVAGSTASPTAG